ncbi:MAG: hypothetical protein J6K04_03660 [Lachnospiraceae bacterium]|nr:hypothetical protein [Lachnospiraceae bacterium]
MSHHELITKFTKHYMEKLFYFCLKRTGNSDEAENLTQDIALNIIPDILVITKTAERNIKKKMEEHKKYATLLRYFQETYEEVKSIFKGYSHKILHDHIGYNIFMEMYNTRMMSVHDLVESGFLKIPEPPYSSTVGMYLWLQ